MKKILSIGILLVTASCFAHKDQTWDSLAEFECAATNALADVSVLVSEDFGNSLVTYIANVTNHESQIEALFVLGERHLSSYNETMKIEDLRNALVVSSNVCELTSSDTNSWQSSQARLLLFTCLVQSTQMEQAYCVASEALAAAGARDIATDNIVSAALLKHNRAQDLSIRQAIVLAKALSAAMLKRKDEATNLATELPIRYHDMVIRLANSDD